MPNTRRSTKNKTTDSLTRRKEYEQNRKNQLNTTRTASTTTRTITTTTNQVNINLNTTTNRSEINQTTSRTITTLTASAHKQIYSITSLNSSALLDTTIESNQIPDLQTEFAQSCTNTLTNLDSSTFAYLSFSLLS